MHWREAIEGGSLKGDRWREIIDECLDFAETFHVNVFLDAVKVGALKLCMPIASIELQLKRVHTSFGDRSRVNRARAVLGSSSLLISVVVFPGGKSSGRKEKKTPNKWQIWFLGNMLPDYIVIGHLIYSQSCGVCFFLTFVWFGFFPQQLCFAEPVYLFFA